MQNKEVHKNSHENTEDHHLYEIKDLEENCVFKFGISCEELKEDGTSSRAEKQTRFLNRAVGWIRYIANVLKTGIKGRIKAEEIEELHITSYEQEYGQRPRGNPPKGKHG